MILFRRGFDRRPALGLAVAILATAALPGLCPQARADEAADCAANAGSYLTGVVAVAPYYKGGRDRKGVELSHTHVTIIGDADGKRYDVAMDNVFASGYDAAGPHVPSPLSGILQGDHLGLCGQLYPDGSGIHWVHTNCGDKPSAAKPNGWVRKLDAGGQPTTGNLEDNGEYCRLW